MDENEQYDGPDATPCSFCGETFSTNADKCLAAAHARIAELEAGLRAKDSDLATAEALCLSHEGRIFVLEAELTKQKRIHGVLQTICDEYEIRLGRGYEGWMPQMTENSVPVLCEMLGKVREENERLDQSCSFLRGQISIFQERIAGYQSQLATLRASQMDAGRVDDPSRVARVKAYIDERPWAADWSDFTRFAVARELIAAADKKEAEK